MLNGVVPTCDPLCAGLEVVYGYDAFENVLVESHTCVYGKRSAKNKEIVTDET